MSVVEHGGNIEKVARMYGLSAEHIIDFSANINPLGIPVSAKESMLQAWESLERYPDIDYVQARQTIAKQENVPLATVVLLNGAIQGFYEVAKQLKPKHLYTLSPTFMEYEQAFLQQQAAVRHYVLQETADYQWRATDFIDQLTQLEAGDVVLVCNPNNPTGSLIDAQQLQQLLAYVVSKDAYLVIDEAFMDFVANKDVYTMVQYITDCPQLIIVKSLTKFYAIPGLRLGYLLTSNTQLLNAIQQSRMPWEVNALAVAALPALLEDKAYQVETMRWLSEEKAYLYGALKQFKQLQVIEPSVNYIFFKYTGEQNLQQALLQHHILIRSCANYHHLTTQHYRVAIKSSQDNRRLIDALFAVLGEKS